VESVVLAGKLRPFVNEIKRDYNIAYSRRRFLRPMLPDEEIREMVALELACFPPPENYDFRTLRMFLSLNGAGLLRIRDIVDEKPMLVAFHLFDCLAGELITLDVHPDFRRRGLGAQLLIESMTKLREFGHKHAVCQIGVENKASLELHKKFGFEAVRRLKNYYGAGRDAYLLSAPLTKHGARLRKHSTKHDA
jgi:[ribosomal protein S18]-alanine N-acetyltransferase